LLAAYLTQFNELIQAPNSPIPLISSANATVYINVARNQVAGEGECIRVPATLAIVAGTIEYPFSAISLAQVTGASKVISVRMGAISTSRLAYRNWEWFFNYYLNAAAAGTPTTMAQQGQGEAGTLWVYPTPTAPTTANLDVVATPIALVDDTTVEAIPYPWTDAVPFYAAWLGMQNMQRQGDADKMLARYSALMRRARQMSSPSVLPGNLPGDMGTREAAGKTSLTEAPQAQAGR
jgi:hypothetical protein